MHLGPADVIPEDAHTLPQWLILYRRGKPSELSQGVPESSHKPFAQVWCLGVYNWPYNNSLEHLVFRSHISESHRIVKYGEFSLQMGLGTLEYICQHQEHWWSWGGNPGRAATSCHQFHVSRGSSEDHTFDTPKPPYLCSAQGWLN